MKWTIPQLQKFRDNGFTIDETADMSELTKIDPQIRRISPIRVFGKADLGSNRVTFHVKISGTLTLPCSRTLVDVPFPIDVQTTETFLFNRLDGMEDEDGEFHLAEGDVVDLTPVIKEIILTEIPMQIFCDTDNPANGAPQSGDDWEVLSEDQQVKKVDPRLAKLAQLFDKQDDHDKDK